MPETTFGDVFLADAPKHEETTPSQPPGLGFEMNEHAPQEELAFLEEPTTKSMSSPAEVVASPKGGLAPLKISSRLMTIGLTRKLLKMLLPYDVLHLLFRLLPPHQSELPVAAAPPNGFTENPTKPCSHPLKSSVLLHLYQLLLFLPLRLPSLPAASFDDTFGFDNRLPAHQLQPLPRPRFPNLRSLPQRRRLLLRLLSSNLHRANRRRPHRAHSVL